MPKINLILRTILFSLLIGAILLYSFYFANAIFLSVVCLIILAFMCNVLLSELMVGWLMLLSIALATVILVSGVVYMPLVQRILLIFVFPLALNLGNTFIDFHHLRVTKIKDETRQADQAYQALLRGVKGENIPVQAFLIHWSHNEYFKQVHSKEYRRMLKRIQRAIKQTLKEEDLDFYVSNGNFLILSADDALLYDDHFLKHIQPKLLDIHFKNIKSVHEVQYQKGHLIVNQGNLNEVDDLDKLLTKLLRQLETDIIVEY